MRAWVRRKFGAVGGLLLEERAIPEIGPRDVLVRVHASSLNRRDLLVAEGISVGGEPRLGAIPLSDGAGEVVAIGTGVSRIKVGNKSWHRSVLALTDGLGADILIETGGAGTYPESLRALRPGGRLSIVGILNGVREDAPTFDTIFFRDLTVRAVQPGSRLDLEALLRTIAASLLRPVIDSSFAFHDAPQAFARLAEGSPFGKIVVVRHG
jgi:NADPH:quinone reductase-like Zn-dependent oxidoreductase